MASTPSRNLLEELVPQTWDQRSKGGAPQTRWLQQLSDLTNRPVNNRQTNSTSATAVAANGAVQSTGIGTLQAQQPKRYAEFTVKARVTFNVDSVGPAYVYVYRTQGAIPANGAPPNAGDVVVGGDAFVGGAMTSGVNQSGALSYLDQGLNVNQKYSYYLAIVAPGGNTVNLVNASQLLVMERS
jgi:hypothetical protein